MKNPDAAQRGRAQGIAVISLIKRREFTFVQTPGVLPVSWTATGWAAWPQ